MCGHVPDYTCTTGGGHVVVVVHSTIPGSELLQLVVCAMNLAVQYKLTNQMSRG